MDACRATYGLGTVKTLALALTPQLVSGDVPTESHDRVLDAVVHPDGWVFPAPATPGEDS